MLRAFFLLLLMLASARGESAHVTVAGQRLRIPAPEGFRRYDGKAEKVDGLQASFVPPSNHILAAFGEADDLQSVTTEKFPHLTRSFNAQENWQFQDAPLTPAEFASVKIAIREQMDGLKSNATAATSDVEKSASSALSHALDANLKVKVGEIVSLGTFAETPEAICFSLLVKSRLIGGPLEEPIEPITVVGGCLALVKDRLVYLYANSAYDGKLDAEWTAQQIVRWRDAVLAANAPGAPPDDDLPPEPMADADRVWWQRRGAIAAVVLVVAGLWFFRKKPLRLP